MQLDINSVSHKRGASQLVQGSPNKKIKTVKWSSKERVYLKIQEEWRSLAEKKSPAGDLFKRTDKVFKQLQNPSKEFCSEFLSRLSNEKELEVIADWIALHSSFGDMESGLPTALKSYEIMIRHFFQNAVPENEAEAYRNCKCLIPLSIVKSKLSGMELPRKELVKNSPGFQEKVDGPFYEEEKIFSDGKVFNGKIFANYFQGNCFQMFEDGSSSDITTFNDGKFFYEKILDKEDYSLLITGEGVCQCSNGRIYFGEFDSGWLRSGVFKGKNFIYEGFFADNQPAGKGVLISDHGYRLEGEFSWGDVDLVVFEGKIKTTGSVHDGKFQFNLQRGELSQLVQ